MNRFMITLAALMLSVPAQAASIEVTDKQCERVVVQSYDSITDEPTYKSSRLMGHVIKDNTGETTWYLQVYNFSKMCADGDEIASFKFEDGTVLEFKNTLSNASANDRCGTYTGERYVYPLSITLTDEDINVFATKKMVKMREGITDVQVNAALQKKVQKTFTCMQ